MYQADILVAVILVAVIQLQSIIVTMYLCSLMGSSTMSQLWLGNVPHGLSEDAVREELSAYNIRPYKLVVRHRGVGMDSYAVASFASAELAAVAREKQAWWSNAKYILMRRAIAIHCSSLLCSHLEAAILEQSS